MVLQSAGHRVASKHFTTPRCAVTLSPMSSQRWATSLIVGGCAVAACSDWGWTRVTKPYAGFELRAIVEEPDVFAPYSIDPESGAAATRSCPGVEIHKERVGPPGAGHDVSYAFSDDEGALRACAKSAEMPGSEILFGPGESGGKAGLRTYSVSRAPFLTGADIARARVVQEHGECWVRLELTEPGRARLAEFSAKHLNQRMAIVLDANVSAAPRIVSPLTGGTASLAVADRVAGEALLRKLTGT